MSSPSGLPTSNGYTAQVFRPSTDPVHSPRQVNGAAPELADYLGFRCAVDMKYKTSEEVGAVVMTIPAGSVTGCLNESGYIFVDGPYVIDVMKP